MNMTNTNATHTPGPWQKVGYADTGFRITGNKVITSMDHGESNQQTKEEYVANAALIAAAPDLLAACEGVLKWWAMDAHTAQDDDEMPVVVFDALSNAIRKAKGEV